MTMKSPLRNALMDMDAYDGSLEERLEKAMDAVLNKLSMGQKLSSGEMTVYLEAKERVVEAELARRRGAIEAGSSAPRSRTLAAPEAASNKSKARDGVDRAALWKKALSRAKAMPPVQIED